MTGLAVVVLGPQAGHADSFIAMSGSLVASAPVALSLGDLGNVNVDAALGGFTWTQDNPVSGDKRDQADFDNAELFFQKTDGRVQFLVVAGAYALPSLGTPYLSIGRTTDQTYGGVPEAFLKLAPAENFSIEAGKLASLIGDESLFSFENLDVERGLIWNQTSSVSRGVQANFAAGPITVSLSWNDGYYSNHFNWLTGLASFALPQDAGTFVLSGGADLGHCACSSFATPLAQDNSTIVDLSYSITLGAWTLNPYVQFSNVPQNRAAGLIGSGQSKSAAMLAIYKLSERWSVGTRAEYISTSGNLNLLYGPGSGAWSLTLTPTYQNGIWFARAEASYVAVSHARPGTELGPEDESGSQARLMIEAGLLL